MHVKYKKAPDAFFLLESISLSVAGLKQLFYLAYIFKEVLLFLFPH